jgi:hypothetical protein
MRLGVTILFCVLFGLVAEGHPQSVKIVGDTLVWWPRDFRGEAVVPSDVRHIGSDAFSSCVELTSVSFPECLETIGSLAFSGCDRLGEVNVPASVTNIGRSAFFNCRTLTNVVIRAKIRMLPDNLCSLCFGLSHVEPPDGLSEIGDMAFRGCRSLQKIDIPRSVKRIGRGAFVGCSRLSVVELPRCMETVDDFAFLGCYDLKRLVLHSVPEKIGTGAFWDCHSLKAYVLSVVPGTNALYSVSSSGEISVENICSEKGFIGKYETVEEAFSIVDKMSKTEPEKGLFNGLEHALRIAADGMVDELPDTFYPIGKIDAFAANLFKISTGDSSQTIKGYFTSHSSTSIDIGNKLVAYFFIPMVADFSIPSDIAITVEFHKEKLTRITLSDGLKNVIRRRLDRQNEKVDYSVLKWIE